VSAYLEVIHMKQTNMGRLHITIQNKKGAEKAKIRRQSPTLTKFCISHKCIDDQPECPSECPSIQHHINTASSLIEMNSNTPTTSPSSDGATSATIASLSPKDLTDEFEQVDTVAELSPRGTFPSTTSVHPKNAFAVSAIDTATAGGDNFNEQFPVNQQVPVHQRNHTMLESMMGLRRAEGNETEGSFYRMIIGSMFAYVVLGIFSWTVFQFMVLINQHECSTAYIGLGANLAANGGSGLGFKDASATMSCLDVFTGTLACAHSITCK